MMPEIVTCFIQRTTKNSNKRKYDEDNDDYNKVTFLKVKHLKELCHYDEK